MLLSPASFGWVKLLHCLCFPVFDKHCIEGWQKQYPEEEGGEGGVCCAAEEVGVRRLRCAEPLCVCRGGSFHWIVFILLGAGGGNDIQWCFSQVKGAVDDDVAEGKSNIFYCFLTFEPFLRQGDVSVSQCCWVHVEQSRWALHVHSHIQIQV